MFTESMTSKILKKILNVSSEEVNICKNSLAILAAKSMTAKSDNLRIKVKTEHTGLTVQTYMFK